MEWKDGDREQLRRRGEEEGKETRRAERYIYCEEEGRRLEAGRSVRIGASALCTVILSCIWALSAD